MPSLAPDIVRAIVEGRQPVGLLEPSCSSLPHPLDGNSECSSKRCEPASAHSVNGLG